MTRPDQRAAAVEAMARAYDPVAWRWIDKTRREDPLHLALDMTVSGRIKRTTAALAALHDAGFAVVPREATAGAIAASVMLSSNKGEAADKPLAAEACLLCSRGINAPNEGEMVEAAAILIQDYRLMIAAADIAAPAGEALRKLGG